MTNVEDGRRQKKRKKSLIPLPFKESRISYILCQGLRKYWFKTGSRLLEL